MTDTKHSSFRFRLLAGAAALAAIIVPVLLTHAQTTATLYTDGTNFGIGTTGPTQKLQVVGTISATSFSGDGSGLTGLPAGGGWSDGGANVYTSTTTDNVAIGTTTPTAALLVQNLAAVDSFRVNNQLSGLGPFVIDQNGNVGIGTSTPVNALGVLGGVSIGNSSAYRVQTAPTNGLMVEGNVGIGTTRVEAALYVNGDMKFDIGADRTIKLFDQSVSGVHGNNLIIEAGGGASPANGGTLTLKGGNAAAGISGDVIILPGQGHGGNVSGNVTITGGQSGGTPGGNVLIEGGNGSLDGNVFLAPANGNVSIGTTSPAGLLTVIGNVGIGTTMPYRMIAGPANGLVSEGNVGIGTWAAANGKLIVMGGNVGVGTTTPVGALTVMNGNVGIGTWSPTQRLQVIGTVNATAFVGDGSGLTGISAGGWSDGGTNVYTSTTTDNVGIGTTTPSTTLEIVKQGTSAPLMVSSAGTGDGDFLFITSAGSVGIGTVSPNSKLEVFGDVRVGVGTITAPSLSFVGDSDTGFYSHGTNSIGIVTNGNLHARFSSTANLVSVTNSGPSINFGGIAAGTPAFGFLGMNAGIYAPSTEIIGFATNGVERMRIDELGDVGIGTTNTINKLTINGGVAVGGITYAGSVAPSFGMIIQGGVGIGTTTPVGALTVMSGNVGIGTWSPRARLEVVGSVLATSFFGDGSNLTGISAGSTGWTDGGTNVYTSTTTDLVAIGTTTPISRLTVKGNVGIGTTTPYTTIAAPLNGMIVEGNVGIGTFAASSAKLAILGGNVGIGTWVPSNTLDVDGLMRATSSITSNFGLNVDYNGANKVLISAIASSGTPVEVFYAQSWSVNGIMGLRESNGVETVRLHSAGSSYFNGGNVGIGTSTPNGGLVVLNGNVGLGEIAPEGGLIVGNGNVGIGTNTPVGALTVMSGNVGIGTWSPRAALEVVGSVLATSFYGDGSNLTGISAGATGWTDGGTNVYTSTTTDNVGIGTTTPNAATFEIVKNAAQPVFKVSSTATGSGDFLMVNSQGNVGVGTVAPRGGLVIMNGNVGIGTTQPTQQLEVFVTDGGESTLALRSTNNYSRIILDPVPGNALYRWDILASGGFNIRDTWNDKIPFKIEQTAGENALVVKAAGSIGIGTSTPVGGTAIMNGNVGIGTWSPRAKLEVIGSVLATSFYGDGSNLTGISAGSTGWTDGGTNVYTTTTTDNVSIGTTTPVGKLTVMGGVGIGTITPYTTIAPPANGLIIDGNVGIGTWAAQSGRLIVADGLVGLGTVNPHPYARMEIFKRSSSSTAETEFGIYNRFIDSGAVSSGSDTNFGTYTNLTRSGATGGSNNVYGDYLSLDSQLSGAGSMLSSGFYAFLVGSTVGTSISTGFEAQVVGADQNYGVKVTLAGDDSTSNTGLHSYVNEGDNTGTLANTSKGAYLNVVDYTDVSSGTDRSYGLDIWTARSGATGGTIESYGINVLVNADNAGAGISTAMGLKVLVSGADTNYAALFQGGNVGIGTDAPSATLELVKQSSNVPLMVSSAASGDGNYLIVTSGGNIGIGTTVPVGALTVMNGNTGIGTWSPRAKLEVIGSVLATSFFGDGSNLTNLPSGGGWSDGGTNVFTSTTTDNVGIGTTTPNAATLEIVQNAAQPALKISSSATGSGDYFVVNSAGNVGIGSVSPNTKLDVRQTSTSASAGNTILSQKTLIDSGATNAGIDYNTILNTSLTRSGATGGTAYSTGIANFVNSSFASGAGSMLIYGIQSHVLSTTVGTTNASAFYGLINGADTNYGMQLLVGGDDSVNNFGFYTSVSEGDNLGTLANTSKGGYFIVSDYTDVSSGTDLSYGLDVFVSRTGATGGTINSYGINVAVSADGAGAGTSTATGLNVSVSGADTNYAALFQGGNVGIGTSSPSATLEVVKQSTSVPLMVSSTGTGDGNLLIITSNGNTGIGTVTPVGALTVMNGNAGIGTWSPRAALEVKNVITYSSEYDEGSEGGAFTINWNNGSKQKVTLTGSTTHAATFTAPTGGVGNFMLKVIQGDATNLVTWPGTVKWPASTAPTLTATSGAIDIVSCYYDGTNYFCSSSLAFGP